MSYMLQVVIDSFIWLCLMQTGSAGCSRPILQDVTWQHNYGHQKMLKTESVENVYLSKIAISHFKNTPLQEVLHLYFFLLNVTKVSAAKSS